MNDDTPESATGPAAGPLTNIVHSIKQLLATLLSMAHTRLELLTSELQQDIQRLAATLLWSLAALFALGTGCLLAALTLILIFWDTHRILVAVSVTAAFFGFALLAILIVVRKSRSHPRLLQGTLSELQRDQEALRARQ